jgi:hypothetical protein
LREKRGRGRLVFIVSNGRILDRPNAAGMYGLANSDVLA